MSLNLKINFLLKGPEPKSHHLESLLQPFWVTAHTLVFLTKYKFFFQKNNLFCSLTLLALQVIRNNPGYGKYMISRLHDKVMISPITVAMNCMLREIDSGSGVSLVTAIEMLAKTKKIDKTSTDTLYSAYLIGKHMFSRHGKSMSLHEMKIVAANHRSILICM